MAQGEDLSSVGLDGISGFWKAAETSETPVTVLSFGDSLQSPWRSLGGQFNQRLQAKLGFAGYTLGAQLGPLAVAAYEGGAKLLDADEIWWTASSSLPSKGAIQWRNLEHPTGCSLADTIGLYFFTSPSPAQFSVLVSSNGGPWLKLASIQAQSLENQARTTQFSLPLGYYQIRLEGESGTSRILGPEMYQSRSHGIKPVFLAQDGCDLNQILSTPPAVLFPILTQIRPHLILWHMKEIAYIGPVVLSNRLRDLEIVLRKTVPQAEVIYIGTPYEQRDTANAVTVAQNRIVRAAAVEAGRAYFDGMSPFHSYDAMVSKGYLDDSEHPSNLLYAEMARMAWDELGFYALRSKRHLDAGLLAGSQVIRYDTSPGLVYRLESSPNLVDWTPRLVSQIPPSGSPPVIRYTNTLPGFASYRLIVLPDSRGTGPSLGDQ